MKTLDLFEGLLNEEFQDLKESLTSPTGEVEAIDIVNEKGDIIIPSKINAEAFKSLQDEFDERLDSGLSTNYIYASNLFEGISDRVKTLRNVDEEKGLEFIFKTLIQRADDNMFAGLLIIKDDFVLNASHPFNMYLLKEELIELPETFDVFVFEFKDERNLSDRLIESAYNMHYLYQSLFLSEAIVDAEYSIKLERESKDFDKIFTIQETDAYLEFRKNSSIDFETILFPLQVLSKGELVPYMGWGAIDKDINSIDLFGNLSGNLRGYHYSNAQEVCTGSKSNRNIEGWYTLSKINYSSTWFSEYLSRYYREIFVAGHKLAKDILLGEADFEDDEEVEDGE